MDGDNSISKGCKWQQYQSKWTWAVNKIVALIFSIIAYKTCFNVYRMPEILAQTLISAKFKVMEASVNLELVNLNFFSNFTHAKLNSLNYFVFGIIFSFPVFSVLYKSPKM